MSKDIQGVAADAAGLSPSVEPVPVSPPDGASIPNAGKVWFAAAVIQRGEKLRCETAWGNGGADATLGWLIARCQNDNPGSSVIHTSVTEVHVERKARWALTKVYITGLVLGALLGLAMAAPLAQAMSAFGQDPKGLEAKPASAVHEVDAPDD